MMKRKSFFNHLMAFACGMLLALPLNGYAQQSVRGDVNGSGVVDIDDINAVINIMLHKADPTAGADVNSDGSVDIDDLNIIINVMLGKDGSGSHGDGDWVDLGLPSGTLWATRNIGADKPEDYGDYFAWGETAPKAAYYLGSYKWWTWYYDNEGNWHGGLTKYCYKNQGGLDGFFDNKTELDFEDDAAVANWGGGARMPSSNQIDELDDNCTWQWTQLNGVNGRLATGPNGNTIFFPGAGCRQGSDGSLKFVTACYYWSRTLSSSGYAYKLLCGQLPYGDYDHFRGSGLSVRAVYVP